MESTTNDHCDICWKTGNKRDVRAVCKECGDLLCQECSDAHLQDPESMNHRLFDIYLARRKSALFDEAELVKYFLEHSTISENTLLYKGKEKIASAISSNDSTKEKHTPSPIPLNELASNDFVWDVVKIKKLREFKVKLCEDDKNVCVQGLIVILNQIIVVDSVLSNEKIKMFDHRGTFLSSASLDCFTRGITHVCGDTFATCGTNIQIWNVSQKEIIKESTTYKLDFKAHGMHYNGKHYCILHRDDNAITTMDSQGKHVKKIVMKKVLERDIMFGWNIHMDSETNNIYLGCRGKNPGILAFTIEGQGLWFHSMSECPFGITQINSALCVVKPDGKCVLLISQTGEDNDEVKLLHKKDLCGKPENIFYDDTEEKLYVSYMKSDKGDAVTVFSVSL